MPPARRLPPQAVRLLRRCAALASEPVYLVGGALRDAWLGRPLRDLDLATKPAREYAKRLARDLKGTLVVLDEGNEVFRVCLPPGKGEIRQVDVARLEGRAIEDDLARRDFAANALALPLPLAGPALSAQALLDPRGGLKDLARKVLRCESEGVLAADPLRLLRAFRLAAQLGFEIDPATLRLIERNRQRVSRPAGERVQAELAALLAAPGSSGLLREMDSVGLLTALIPELEPGRRCAETYYGEGGVLTHSLEVAARLDFLLENLDKVFPAHAKALRQHVQQRSTEGMPHRSVLMLTALLHDVSKPETARTQEGRLRFFGHDSLGAKRASQLLKRLRFPGQAVETAAAVTAQHLRPGHLASAGRITDKAVYRFFRDLGGHALDLLLVCWADHASYVSQETLIKNLPAARQDPGEGPDNPALKRVRPPEARKTLHHLQVIAFLLRKFHEQPQKIQPPPLIDGHDVMKARRLAPGPAVGEWLERVREAQAQGQIRTREQALAFVSRAK